MIGGKAKKFKGYILTLEEKICLKKGENCEVFFY